MTAAIDACRGETSAIGVFANGVLILSLVVTERPGDLTVFVRQDLGLYPTNSNTFLSEFLEGLARLLTRVFEFFRTYRLTQLSEDEEVL